MNTNTTNTSASCQCGHVDFQITGKPLMRAYCHCTICQAENNAAYADVTIFRAKDVIAPPAEKVNFHAAKFPPILQRGKCVQCQQLSIEYLQLFPVPKTVFVPSKLIADQSQLPEPALHIFYDKRVNVINDELPKYSGYLSSQLAISRKLIKALIS